MPNDMRNIIFLMIFGFNSMAQSKHYLSLALHPKYFFDGNERHTILPLNYEFLPAFFNHKYSVGLIANYNNIKLNYTKELSIGFRNTFYLFNHKSIKPYLGFGLSAGDLKIQDRWFQSRNNKLFYQFRVFAGCRVRISDRYLIFSEYGNYRLASINKFNLGVGLTRVFF
jgi:hypothetical protein